MKLAKLFNPMRFLRVRKLAKNALASHIWLSFLTRPMRKKPFKLILRDGSGEINFARADRGVMAFWEAVLAPGWKGKIASINGQMLVDWPEMGRYQLLSTEEEDYSYKVFREVVMADAYDLASYDGALKDATVVDVGLNIGCFAIAVANQGAKVVAAEADPETEALACDNIKASGVEDRVTTINRAVSGKSGEQITFYRAAKRVCSSIDAEWSAEDRSGGARGEVTVQTISLDDLFTLHNVERCFLLKIDIEGGEYPLFEGECQNALERTERVSLELHALPKRDFDQDIDDTIALLKASGFEVELTEKGKATAMVEAERK